MKNDYQNYRPVDIEFLERIPSHWEVKEFRRLFSESSEVNGETPVGKMLSISGYRGVEVKKYDSENKRRSAAEQGCCVLESDLDHREDGVDQLVLGMQRAGGRPDLGQARGA